MEGDQLGVQRCHQDEVAGDGGAAVDLSAAQAQVVRLLVVVAPVDVAGGGVEREYPVQGRRHVHDAVVDGRRDLELLGGTGGKRPRHLEGRGILGRDVIDGRMAVVGVVPAVEQPFTGIRWGAQQMLAGDRNPAKADLELVGPMVLNRSGRRFHGGRLYRGLGGGCFADRYRPLFASNESASRDCRGD